MAEHETTLRCLALNDEVFVRSVMSGRLADLSASRLDPRTHALIRLAASISLDAAPATYQSNADAALAVGATVDDIVDTLVAVTPVIGIARAVSAAPKLGIAVGYDVEAALESAENDMS